jgi:hypothetical protein
MIPCFGNQKAMEPAELMPWSSAVVHEPDSRQDSPIQGCAKVEWSGESESRYTIRKMYPRRYQAAAGSHLVTALRALNSR